MMLELAASFASGFAHPLHGADHIVAMLAVGIWGALTGGRAIRVWPVTFVVTMLAGFASAVAGMSVPFVEPALASSIVALGLLVALAAKAPLGVGAAIIGLFAFFHGHVHGTEAASASLITYASGLGVATAALHAAGIAMCRLTAGSIARVAALRVISALAALGGVLAIVVLQ